MSSPVAVSGERPRKLVKPILDMIALRLLAEGPDRHVCDHAAAKIADWLVIALLSAYGRINRGIPLLIGWAAWPTRIVLPSPFLSQRCRNSPSRREGEKFFEHVAGAGRIRGVQQ
jgi:hypothetical protein